jgi:hypothetical protein
MIGTVAVLVLMVYLIAFSKAMHSELRREDYPLTLWDYVSVFFMGFAFIAAVVATMLGVASLL